MTAQQNEEFTRTCARTGQEKSGKFYILHTTEGQELVHESAFWGRGQDEGQDVKGQPDDDGQDVTEPAPRRGRRTAAPSVPSPRTTRQRKGV